MPDPAQPLGADGFPPSGWTPPAGSGQAPPALAPAASSPAPAPAPAAPAPTAAPAVPKHVLAVRDLSGRPRSEVFELQWPKEIDGVEIRTVEVRRLSTGEIGAFVDAARAARAAGEPGTDLFPIFYRADGALLTDDEWNALDPDDTDALAEKGERFLPARFRTARASDTSTPPASATTGSSSPA